MNQVLFMPEVRNYFKDLVPILYEKGYFSYLERSQRYVKELINDIKKNLPVKLKRPAPEYFKKYGKEMEYAVFTKNKLTTWYVFFDTYKENKKNIYLVRYISNNHVIAQYF